MNIMFRRVWGNNKANDDNNAISTQTDNSGVVVDVMENNEEKKVEEEVIMVQTNNDNNDNKDSSTTTSSPVNNNNKNNMFSRVTLWRNNNNNKANYNNNLSSQNNNNNDNKNCIDDEEKKMTEEDAVEVSLNDFNNNSKKDNNIIIPSTNNNNNKQSFKNLLTTKKTSHSSTSTSSCIYQEAMEMLTGSLVIYLFADIREVAKQQQLEGKEKVVDDDKQKLLLLELEPPLTTIQVLQCIKKNQHILEQRAIDHEDLAKRLKAFHHVEESSHTDSMIGSFFKSNLNSSSFGFRNSNNNDVEISAITKPTLIHFIDDNPEQEIVYAIVVNPIRKRITIAFRGSVTQKDFIQDAKCAQTKVDNPALHLFQDPNDRTEKIRIHAGFYEYITKKDLKTQKSRLDIILEQTKEVLEQNPGYQIYCTGHSLGGALCTLFGFYAAANGDIWNLSKNKPVVIYSFASPYCGDYKFRNVFVQLEKKKRVQHLRIANLEDMVTLLPFFAPKPTMLSPLASAIMGPGNLYKHVGIRLQFKQQEENGNNNNNNNSNSNDNDGGTNNEDSDNVTSTTIQHTFRHFRGYNIQSSASSDEDDYSNKEFKDSLEAGKSLAKAFYAIVRNDFVRVKRHHSCEEYEQRLELCKDHLTNVTLTDLYSDRNIVGDLLLDTVNSNNKTTTSSPIEKTNKKVVNLWSRTSWSKSTTTTTTKDDVSEQQQG